MKQQPVFDFEVDECVYIVLNGGLTSFPKVTSAILKEIRLERMKLSEDGNIKNILTYVVLYNSGIGAHGATITNGFIFKTKEEAVNAAKIKAGKMFKACINELDDFLDQ